MKICGFNKTTLLDYPGRVACTIFLKKRKGILDGVCVSGGEPTLSAELPDFLHEIKNLGYDVKLDTNGSRPSVVKNLAADGLIDKVAMDIKACPSNYHVLTGVRFPGNRSVAT